jgi:hypothetical protein
VISPDRPEPAHHWCTMCGTWQLWWGVCHSSNLVHSSQKLGNQSVEINWKSDDFEIRSNKRTSERLQEYWDIGDGIVSFCIFLTIFHISHNSPIWNCSKIWVNAFTSIKVCHYCCNWYRQVTQKSVLESGNQLQNQVILKSPIYALNSWDRPLRLEFNYIMPFQEISLSIFS